MDMDQAACLQRILLLRRLQRRRREKEQQRTRRMWVRPVLACREEQGEFHTLVTDLRRDPEGHLRYFRMSSDDFDHILDLIKNDIMKQETNMRRPISPAERLAVTLRYLAAGGTMKTIAESYRIAPCTMSAVVYEVCAAIYQRLAPLYLRSPTLDDWRASADTFADQWQLPNCIGAVDGKHVALEKPPRTGTLYHNYKGFCSLVLLAVADARYRFLYISIGSMGSESDGGVFASSDLAGLLRRQMEVGDVMPPPRALPNSDVVLPHFLVGDEAFPLQRHMMRPYPKASLVGPEADARRVFNYRLSRARRCVENAFGIMAQRWRIYRSTVGCAPGRVADLVKATCVLHNLLRQREVDDADVSRGGAPVPDEREHVPTLVDVTRVGTNTHSREAAGIRQALTDYVNGAGSVEWQRAAVGLE